MQFQKSHPAEIISSIMRRVYTQGMTTTSGGNLTQREKDGSIWVTPTRMDKSKMYAQDMMCVQPDGRIDGITEVTSEFPFHLAVLQTQEGLDSVLHAHSLALMAFSFLRKAPNTGLFPALYERCGTVGIAPYATPGTDGLAEEISGAFRSGAKAFIMENHGVVVGAPTPGTRLYALNAWSYVPASS